MKNRCWFNWKFKHQNVKKLKKINAYIFLIFQVKIRAKSSKNILKNKFYYLRCTVDRPLGPQSQGTVHRVRARSIENISRSTGTVHGGWRWFHVIRWFTFILTQIGRLTVFSSVIKILGHDLTAQIPSIARSNGWGCFWLWIGDQRHDLMVGISSEARLNGQNRIQLW